jgi:hypothetical protein
MGTAESEVRFWNRTILKVCAQAAVIIPLKEMVIVEDSKLKRIIQ